MVPPSVRCSPTDFASAPPGSSIDRSGATGRDLESPWPYHQGMPFCANTTGVSGPSSGPTLSASAGRPVALSVEITASCGPRSAGRSEAWTLATILLSPAIRVRPLARIASRWAPRATTETSLPVSARRAAKLPPMAPAPNTQIRMNRLSLAGYRRAKLGRKNMALGEYRGLAYRNNADLAAWLAKRPRGEGARARAADHRSAPSSLGHAGARPLLPARAAGAIYGGGHNIVSHGVPRMPGDVPRLRAGGDEAGRRGRVRERPGGAQRLGPVRQDAGLRGDHRLGRPDAGRRACGRCWRP